MRFWRQWLHCEELVRKEWCQQLSSGEGGWVGKKIGMCGQIRWGEMVDILKSLSAEE